jgi:predicted nucleotidyltransferase
MTQALKLAPILEPANQRKLEDVCAHNGITWLAVFGSVARGEAREDSDVDVLVEFHPGSQISYLDVARIADELSPLFDNRRVDLGKPEQIHWFIRERVMAEARVLYAR